MDFGLKKFNLFLQSAEKILLELFENDANYLDHITNSSTRSNLRTLILIYDYLKWGKYNIVLSRLEDLKDKVLELKELEDGENENIFGRTNRNRRS